MAAYCVMESSEKETEKKHSFQSCILKKPSNYDKWHKTQFNYQKHYSENIDPL